MSSILNEADGQIAETANDHRIVGKGLSKTVIPRLQNELALLMQSNASIGTILAKNREIDEAKTKANAAFDAAIDLDTKSLLESQIQTDVVEASAAITCSTNKVLLAINHLEDISKILKIVGIYTRLGVSIANAAIVVGAGGIPVANITDIIEEIDALVSFEFKKSLSDEDLKKLRKDLQKCIPRPPKPE